MNGTRPKARLLLVDPSVQTMAAGYRHRLGRVNIFDGCTCRVATAVFPGGPAADG